MTHSPPRTSTSTNQEDAKNRAQKLAKEVRQLAALLTREEESNIALQDENRNLRTNYAGMKAELKATNQALSAATKEVENRKRKVQIGSSRSNSKANAIDRERRPYGPREQPAGSPKSFPTMRSRNRERPVEDRRKLNGPRPQCSSSYRPPYVEEVYEKEDW